MIYQLIRHARATNKHAARAIYAFKCPELFPGNLERCIDKNGMFSSGSKPLLVHDKQKWLSFTNASAFIDRGNENI